MNIGNFSFNPQGYNTNINPYTGGYNSGFQLSQGSQNSFSQNSISSLVTGLIGQLLGGNFNSSGSSGFSGLGNGFNSGGFSSLGNGFNSGGFSSLGNGFNSGGFSGLGNGFNSGGFSSLGNGFNSGGFSSLGNGFNSGGFSSLSNGFNFGGFSSFGSAPSNNFGFAGNYGQPAQSFLPIQLYQQPQQAYYQQPQAYYQQPQQTYYQQTEPYYQRPEPAPRPVQAPPPPPRGVSISKQDHTGALDDGKFVKLRGWHDGGSRVQLWKHVGNTGDIDLIGVHALPDGTIVATSGNEEIHNISGRARPLVDANGDGYVFKLSPQGTDGRFRFEVDRGHGGGVLRGYLNG